MQKPSQLCRRALRGAVVFFDPDHTPVEAGLLSTRKATNPGGPLDLGTVGAGVSPAITVESLCRARRPAPLLPLLFVLISSVAALAAEAPVQLTVRSTGYAEGVGYGARERAINDARQRALVEVIQSYMGTDDLQLFRPILRNAAAYVPVYDLLRHDQAGQDTRVEIDAYVQEAPLQRDIATIMLPRLPEKPRVLLVIGEQIADDAILAVPDFGAAEVALAEALKEKGLEVSGANTLEKLYSQEQLIKLVQGGVEEGSKFARENTAHVVVVGTAKSAYLQEKEEVNMKKNTAQVRLSIYRGSDGKMVDDAFAEAVVHAADPFEGGEAAVQDACRKAQANVITAAAMAVLSTQATDNMLITILHPGNTSRLDAFTTMLAKVQGAGKPQVLYFSEALARVSLPYDGPTGALVDAVAEFKFEKQGLDVTRVLKKDMEVVFK